MNPVRNKMPSASADTLEAGRVSNGVKRHLNTLLITVFLIILGLLTSRLSRSPATIVQTVSSSSPLPSGYVRVAQAIDGDTIELEDGRRVRYIGIDTPETVHPKKKVQCFGPEASARNHELVDGKAVRLVKDIEDTDRYGRLLRYVYLEDGTFVNQLLVREGFAHSYVWPPNIAYTQEFRVAHVQAQSTRAGLWGACQK